MEMVSSLQAVRRESEAGAQAWWEQSTGGRYQVQLQAIAPEVPLPFLEDGLNFVIRKRSVSEQA